MRKEISLTALLLAMVVAAGAAQAQGHGNRPSFDALDLNSDGTLSRAELQAQAGLRFETADANGDGALSEDELIAAASSRAQDRIERMMERFDTNGDGLLQQAELPRPGEGRTARMFERVDANRDGLISEDEFEAAKARMQDRRDGRGLPLRDRG
ncbi:EF-hand domain-containing protein [Yoonia litorea]|uniref:EF hand n=1 Tax=Yoonia litorea TaxID=1123755 RepID=A0A1I6LGJ8_9RHOB|nr:hypothetical protein [Yoonia litorea]SFS02418.1 EF hand [Yoonia litorea]